VSLSGLKCDTPCGLINNLNLGRAFRINVHADKISFKGFSRAAPAAVDNLGFATDRPETSAGPRKIKGRRRRMERLGFARLLVRAQEILPGMPEFYGKAEGRMKNAESGDNEGESLQSKPPKATLSGQANRKLGVDKGFTGGIQEVYRG